MYNALVEWLLWYGLVELAHNLKRKWDVFVDVQMMREHVLKEDERKKDWGKWRILDYLNKIDVTLPHITSWQCEPCLEILIPSIREEDVICTFECPLEKHTLCSICWDKVMESYGCIKTCPLCCHKQDEEEDV